MLYRDHGKPQQDPRGHGKTLEDGFTREEIENCHMPIGTAIGAETPAEIAVSIAGELIHIRALREGRRKC